MDARRPTPQRLAWQRVLAISIATVALLIAFAPAYGFHRDELYFVAIGRHPAWGYVDQPPLTPLVSAATAHVLGVSPTALRILPAIAIGICVVLTAWMAALLGGRARAQLIAALTVAVSGLLAAGHLASTTTFDLLFWTLICWAVLRILTGADPRTWLFVGLVAGVALENKGTVLLLAAGLGAGIVAARRDVLRTRWPWAGGLVALALWAPHLAWQAEHGWPQLEMARSLQRDSAENRMLLLPMQLLLAGPLLFPVALIGLEQLLRRPALAAARPFGWAYLTALVLLLGTAGKGYYVAGLLPPLMAAGSSAVDRWIERPPKTLRRASFFTAAALSFSLIAVLTLPVLPPAVLAATPLSDVYPESAEQVGWPELVRTVERVTAALPEQDRARAAVVTANYGEAGALLLLGTDLPPVHSVHNSLWDLGPPDDGRTLIVLVGYFPPTTVPLFGDCRVTARFDNGYGLRNQEQGAPVRICRSSRTGWSEVWRTVRSLG